MDGGAKRIADRSERRREEGDGAMVLATTILHFNGSLFQFLFLHFPLAYSFLLSGLFSWPSYVFVLLLLFIVKFYVECTQETPDCLVVPGLGAQLKLGGDSSFYFLCSCPAFCEVRFKPSVR